MKNSRYQSMNTRFHVNRRNFLKTSGVIGTGLVLGTPPLWGQDKKDDKAPPRAKTNIDEAMKVPRTPMSLPGPFPGRVIEVHDPGAMVEDKVDPAIVSKMFQTGLTKLTGMDAEKSFGLFFNKDDVVGIKVNPIGAGLISTRLELVHAIIDWLTANNIRKENIIIWDRFDLQSAGAGFDSENFPGVGIESLQTVDENVVWGDSEDNSSWMDENGNHVSIGNFDKDVYYWADVEAPKDQRYLCQHVFNGKYSYFGKLLTRKLTKIINVPVLKNTGNGISVATKNLGYGAICNNGRLHEPLFFDVCTEVLAFPTIRDKLVLNITDGLRAQYDGGPGPAAKFAYVFNGLFFATDPFASDLICHNILVEKRKAMGVKVNEHPKYTEYLRYAERLGLGVADPTKIEHVIV